MSRRVDSPAADNVVAFHPACNGRALTKQEARVTAQRELDLGCTFYAPYEVVFVATQLQRLCCPAAS